MSTAFWLPLPCDFTVAKYVGGDREFPSTFLQRGGPLASDSIPGGELSLPLKADLTSLYPLAVYCFWIEQPCVFFWKRLLPLILSSFAPLPEDLVLCSFANV